MRPARGEKTHVARLDRARSQALTTRLKDFTLVRAAETSERVFATLRKCVEAAERLGLVNGWVPADGSVSAGIWTIASVEWQTPDEALARTVAEAEVHAVALVRSGLEHADLVSRTVARGLAYAPHTVGRTAEEHLLRALHYLVTSRAEELGSIDDQRAIAEVRLNQVLSNLHESERLQSGLLESDWGDVVNRQTVDDQWDRCRAIAKSIGWAIERTRQVARLAHTPKGRLSTMTLASTYLADQDTSLFDGRVLTQLIARTHGAIAHGYETGLLSSTRMETRDDLAFAALTIEPEQMEVGQLTFDLMLVPLCVGNTVDALAERFGWADGKAYETYMAARGKMIEAWATAVDPPALNK